MIVTDQIYREDVTHTYWNRKTGRRVVGITELLKQMGYLGNMPMNNDALRRGRNVHLALHYYAKGTLAENSLSPTIRPYFDSAMEFITKTGAKILMSETFVMDEVVPVVAQLDAVMQIFNGRAVVDYKSGLVSDWVRYQTAAHVNGLPPLPKEAQPYRRFGLELCADGSQAILTEFKDPTDMLKVRMFASTFYTRVNDGIVDWPQTWDGLERKRSEDYGLDLFTDIRNGQENSGRNTFQGSDQAAPN